MTFPGRQPDPVPGQISMGRTEGVDKSDSVRYDRNMSTATQVHPGQEPDVLRTRGRIKRIHVNQHAIKAGDTNCVTIQTSEGPFRCAELHIEGDSYMVARLSDPLSCGARVWIETHAPVRVHA
jgi:hypothetical protein